MENSPPEPFVIWFNGIGAHPPYSVHKEYEDAFPPEEIKKVAPLRPHNLKNKPKYHSPDEGI